MIVELTATACYCKRCFVSVVWQPRTGEYCMNAGGGKHDWVKGDVLMFSARGEWDVVRHEALPVMARGAGFEPA